MCNSVFQIHSFQTAFETPHSNAKQTSHLSGNSKRQEGCSEICQFNENCNCVFDIHSFQTAFETPHCTVKCTLQHLVIPKGKKEAQKSDN